jgi:hypothetical protein
MGRNGKAVRLAPTCDETAQGLERERERMARSIEELKAAHAMLESIIRAGEPAAAQAD